MTEQRALSVFVGMIVLYWVGFAASRVVDAMAVHALFDLLGIAAAYALYARRA